MDYRLMVESESIACAAESGGDPGLAGAPPSVGIPSAVGAIVSTGSRSVSPAPCSEFSFRAEQADARPAAISSATNFEVVFM